MAGQNPAIRTVLLAIAVVVVAWLLARSPSFALMETRLEDERIAWLAPAEPIDPRITVVAIDDAALARLPSRSPIDRTYLARVIRAVSSGSPRAIGLDVVLDRPTGPAADAALAEALRSSRAPVVLAGDGPDATVLPGLAAPAVIVGDARLRLDAADGVVRHMPESALLPRAMATLLAGPAPRAGTAGDRRIDYALRGDGGAVFPVISADALLEGKVEPLALAGRIVLIGAVLVDADRHQTPVSSHDLYATGMSGVLIHAYQVRTLLDADPARADVPGSLAPASLAFATLAALAGLGLWQGGRRVLTRLLLVSAILPTLLFAGLLAWRWAGVLVSLTWTTLAFLLAFIAGAVLAQRRARESLDGAVRRFSRYLSPEAAQALASPAGPDGTPARAITAAVLVTDLEDFSGLVEANGADAIKPLLDGYIDTITDCVVRQHGTTDKIVGDGVHAWFEQRDGLAHAARRAGQCALAIAHATTAFATSHPELGRRRTRIGVACGEVLIGSFGSGERLDFTVHGAVVHAAARLEQANKQFGTTIAVTETIARACRQEADWRDLGETELRGLDGRYRVFTPIAQDSVGALLRKS